MTTLGTSTTPNPMLMMEHAENGFGVPPLVDLRVLLNFCQAAQSYADSVGSHDEVAGKLRALQASLADLRNLAGLCRLAVVGHPHSFARVIDEMYCLSVDFPTTPLDDDPEGEFCEDEIDTRVDFTAAIDLFAGASFVSKNDREQRDRFVVALVRAIEAAIAFPVTFSVEAAAYIGQGVSEIAPLHASIVVANATRRLLEGDYLCIPRAPRDLRGRLEHLARHWMRSNPVTTFLEVVSGPPLRRIVHWEDPARARPDDARVGDPVTLLVQKRNRGETAGRTNEGPATADATMAMSASAMATGGDTPGGATYDPCDEGIGDLAVVFCPHQPAPVVRIVDDGLQVRVPEGACTGPIAVVKKTPDFKKVGQILDDYFGRYPTEMNASMFGAFRMDMWAYPFAFGPPVLEVLKTTKDPRSPQQPQLGALRTPNPVVSNPPTPAKGAAVLADAQTASKGEMK